MKLKNRRGLVWLVDFGIGIALCAAMILGRGVLRETSEKAILSGLCDAFFVPGILLVCFGALAFSAYGGIFDMLAYGAHSLLVLFTPFRKPEKHMRYYEYKLMKEARRKKPRPVTLTVGCLFILLAGVCLVMYNRIPE